MGALMAWVEHREGHVRVVWRDPDTGGKTYEKFATEAEAGIYRALVEQARGRRPETLYEEPGRPARPLGNLSCTVTRWAEFWLSGLSGVRDRIVADYRGTVERSILLYFGQMDIRDPSAPTSAAGFGPLPTVACHPRRSATTSASPTRCSKLPSSTSQSRCAPPTPAAGPGSPRWSRRRCASSPTSSSTDC